jgi:crossover junction endodeoxyribonuclease RuvC
MTDKVILGFDPGIGGGVALLSETSEVLVIPTPIIKGKGGAKSLIDIEQLVRWIKTQILTIEQISLACVEKVHAMPKQGVTACFTFGMGYGQLLGMLATLSIPTELVTPQQWKKEVLKGSGKEKSHAIQYVRRRYPNVSLLATSRSKKPHDGMAEALCIAEYGRRLLWQNPNEKSRKNPSIT